MAKANKHVHEDVEKMALVQVDATTWLVATEIGAALNVCSLVAVHIACTQRLRIAKTCNSNIIPVMFVIGGFNHVVTTKFCTQI